MPWRPPGWEPIPDTAETREEYRARRAAERQAEKAAARPVNQAAWPGGRAPHVQEGFERATARARFDKDIAAVYAVSEQRMPNPRFLPDAELIKLVERLARNDRYDWATNARPEQMEPPSYRNWLIMAGRGWGKTRTGAETVKGWCRIPGTRIAVVAKAARELRDIDMEGVSGLLSVFEPHEIKAYRKGLGDSRIELTNGSSIHGYGLPMDCPIPTPTGWTPMGVLQDGDEVFDETGRPCRILKAWDSYMPQRMYRITFSDGATIEADGDHLWVTWTKLDRENLIRLTGTRQFPVGWPSFSARLHDSWGNVRGSYGPRVRDTDEIVRTLLHPHATRRVANHCIPVAGRLELPEVDLPLDPYVLGYWLGDGSTGEARFTCHEDDQPELNLALSRFHPHPTSHPQRIAVYGLTKPLARAGVLRDKHVPPSYLRASARQRLDLLRGLMDSDGTAHIRGDGVSFANTNPRLTLAVFELAGSLGERPFITRTKPSTSYGPNAQPGWKVSWHPQINNPFQLKRKAVRVALRPQIRTRYRSIMSCESIEPRRVRCITVDSPNAMYLASRWFIPTHNSAGEPDAIRGQSFDAAWFDEFAAWPHWTAADMRDQVWFCLRESADPRVVITTTPKRVAHVLELIKRERSGESGIVITRGRTIDNAANLGAAALAELEARYAGTRLGSQELSGELLEDVEGALWTEAMLTTARWEGDLPPLKKVITGFDPSGSATGDATGIVTIGYDDKSRIFVLECMSTRGLPAERYTAACLSAYRCKADLIMVEYNFGGDNARFGLERQWDHLVETGVISAKRPPVEPSTLKGDKAVKASPVAALYEQQMNTGVERIFHAPGSSRNGIDALESELTSWEPGDKKSPNSLDALVIAGRRAMRELGWEPSVNSASPKRRIDPGGYRPF